MPYALIRCTADARGGKGAVYALFASGAVRNVSSNIELDLYGDLDIHDDASIGSAARLANAHEACFGPMV